jgi:hypothetical protein
MRRGRKSSWEWILAQEKDEMESEGGKNMDKKIVMVKLTVQKKEEKR